MDEYPSAYFWRVSAFLKICPNVHSNHVIYTRVVRSKHLIPPCDPLAPLPRMISFSSSAGLPIVVIITFRRPYTAPRLIAHIQYAGFSIKVIMTSYALTLRDN